MTWFLEREALRVPVSRHPADCQREEVVWRHSWESSLLLFLLQVHVFYPYKLESFGFSLCWHECEEGICLMKTQGTLAQKGFILKLAFPLLRVFFVSIASVLRSRARLFLLKRESPQYSMKHFISHFTVILFLGIYSCSS